MTCKTKNLITKKELSLMKNNVCLINTSRHGILNEKDVLNFLKKNSLVHLASDVFQSEPNYGKLAMHSRCISTPHLGSMSFRSRVKMEEESVKNLINFFKNKKIKNKVNYE